MSTSKALTGRKIIKNTSLELGFREEQVKRVFESFLKEIKSAVKRGDRIIIPNIISIKPVVRKEKKARNIKKNVEIVLPETTVYKAYLSKKLGYGK